MTWSAGIDRTTGALISSPDWNKYLGVTGSLMETAAAKVTTAGDIVYATGANALARLAAVASGQVLASQGVGVAPAWQTPVQTSSSASLGSDTGMSVSAIWTDVGVSIASLAAGQYLFLAQINVFSTAGGSPIDFRIVDSTGATVYAVGTVTIQAAGSTYYGLALVGRTTLGSTTTIKLQYNVAAGSSTYKVASTTGVSGSTGATTLVAARIV